MAKQPESRMQKKIHKHLKATVGGWWVKFWGGPFTPAGVPDLIGSVDGLFFALEVKLPRRGSEPSEIQLKTIARIVLEGGGVSTVVRSPQEAEYVVNRALAEAARSVRIREGSKRGRLALRTKNWKDLHNPETPRNQSRGRRR